MMTPALHFYTGFTAEQFAGNDYFRQWVLAPDGVVGEFWLEYLQLYPGQEDAVEAARILVNAGTYGNLEGVDHHGMSPLEPEEKSLMKEGIFNKLATRMRVDTRGLVDGVGFVEEKGSVEEKGLTGREGLSLWRRMPLRMAAAAAILVVVASIFLLRYQSRIVGTEVGLLAERTGANETKTILLPDSSVIVLNANSTMEYSDREVKLEGNAFFRIRKDVGYRSFVVHTRSLAITVLGTELNVNARSAAAEVGLISGKVKVEKAGNETVYLLPGDKVRLDTMENKLVRSTMNPMIYSAWTEGKWNFRNTSLEDIGGLIRDYYGIEVTYFRPQSKRLIINAVIAVGSLQKLIPVLEQTLHIKMVLSENRLAIE